MIPITRPELPPLDDYVSLLREVWASRMLSNFAHFAQELERMTEKYLAVPTRAVVSGDIGLVLTIAALDLPAGSNALVPSFTFNSTVNSLLWNNLRPVFVDVDPLTLNMDPAAASEAAAAWDPKLILATHVFGNPADTAALEATARLHGARLVFDAAHGYGSRRGEDQVGSFGDAEVFSLSGTKLVTTAEGGLIATANATLIASIELRRGYGFKGDYNSKVRGLNGKMSELHAALGLLTIARIEAALAARFVLVERYRRNLSSIPGLAFQHVREGDRSTFKDFAVIFENPVARTAAEDSLARDGVQTKRYFRPCHTMDAFSQFAGGPLPVTESTYSRILCLPLYESLPPADVDRISETVARAIRES